MLPFKEILFQRDEHILSGHMRFLRDDFHVCSGMQCVFARSVHPLLIRRGVSPPSIEGHRLSR